MERIEECDVVIVGAAAAGLTAAMYTSRRALSTVIISKDLGGQAALTSEIENYPGRSLTDGFVLMNDFKEQAEAFGARIVMDEVVEIQAESDTSFVVRACLQSFRCKGVIITSGLTPKDLSVPGEQQWKGRGVSYCATCDGPLFKNKSVVVCGVGDSALDAALYLHRLNATVTYLCPRPALVGSPKLRQSLQEEPIITTLCNATVIEILGDTKLTCVRVNVEGQLKDIACDGVFVEMGYIAKTDWLAPVMELDERRQVKIDQQMMTSRPGIFAAGDITTISYKQVVISAGEGAKAALSLYHYLQERGAVAKRPPIDWGVVHS